VNLVRIASMIAVGLVLFGQAGPAAAQAPERAWRETLQLDAPLLAAKRWENARGLIEQGSWEAALEALGELEADFPDELVNVAPGRYLSLPLAVRLLRLHLPAEGLEIYRQQIDGWAEQQLESARRWNDESALRQIADTALASRHADEALDRLAARAWERGEIDTARTLWRQIIPVDPPRPEDLRLRLPGTDLDIAGLHARLILCSLAEGDVQRAERELGIFAERFPAAEGSLAGESGPLVEILQRLVADTDQWPPPIAERSWPTFAGSAGRNAVLAGQASIGRAVWTLPLDPVYVPRWERPRTALPERGLLSRFAVTWGEGAFFHDGLTVRGVRLSDGRPLWPTNSVGTATEQPGRIYPPFPVIPNRLPPGVPVVGLPRHTLLAHEGRLTALLGPSVLTAAGQGQPSPTRLVCLDLQEEGLLQWFHIPEDLFAPGWLISGSPVAEGDFLYVPLLRSNPQIEVGAACLDASDGTLVWQRTIGQALRDPLAGRVELGHQLLSYADGQVFHATGFGGVAALDARTGRIDWVVTYPSFDRETRARSDESRVGLMPPLYHEGTLLVKPDDADEILAIDAASGHVHWRRPTPGPVVHLLGAAGTRLFVSGHHLWSIDLDTGSVLWRFGFDDVGGYGYGRGVILGDRAVWPTHEELFVVDLASGQMHRRVRLYESLGLSGGNIIAGENRLLIAGPDHLTAFELLDAATNNDDAE
jgi:hypothetical protein